jgi:hypothetical protein
MVQNNLPPANFIIPMGSQTSILFSDMRQQAMDALVHE